ncbi:MAG: hypothetical protein HC799_01325 [Limnothrix sp. RL_2_0]|nr:hypothetical protein [Limnothrix sp. RL_2_0]
MFKQLLQFPIRLDRPFCFPDFLKNPEIFSLLIDPLLKILIIQRLHKEIRRVDIADVADFLCHNQIIQCINPSLGKVPEGRKGLR